MKIFLICVWLLAVLGIEANANCSNSDKTDLTALKFTFDGNEITSIKYNSELKKNLNISWNLHDAPPSKSSPSEINYFPDLKKLGLKSKASFKYLQLDFKDAAGKVCSNEVIAFNPNKLCKKGSVFEPWTFHRSFDNFLSVISENVTLNGTPYLRNSTLCGKTEVNYLVAIRESTLKGWGAGEGKLLVQGDTSWTEITNNSSILGYSTIRENVSISESQIEGNSFITGGSPNGIDIHRSKVKDTVKLVGNVTITDSNVERGSFESLSEQITVENYSILKGDHVISRIVRIDNSTVDGAIKIEGTSLRGIEIVNSNIVHDPSLGEMKFQGKGTFFHLNSTGLNSFEGGYFGVDYSTLSGNNSFSSTNSFHIRNSVITGEHDIQVGNLTGSISFSNLTPLAGNKSTLIGAVSLNNCEISGIYNSIAGFGCAYSNISGNLSILGAGTNYIETTTVEGTNILNIADRIEFHSSILHGGATFQGRMNIDNSEFSGDTYIQGDGNISASKFLIEPGKILDMRARVFSISAANFSTTTEFIFDEYTTSGTKFFGSIKASGRLLRLSDSEIGADAEITGDCNTFYTGSKVGSGTKLATISTTYSNCFEFRGVLISPDLNVTLEPIGNNSRSWCSITYSGLNPYCAPYTPGKDGIKGNVLVNYGIDPAESEAIESQLH